MSLWGVLTLIGIAVTLFAVILWLAFSGVKKLSLQKKSRLLSPAEKSFYGHLTEALSDEFYLFSKIRTSDVVKPSSNLRGWKKYKHLRFLKQQNFDYVLCKRHDLSIYGVIELENFERSNRKRELIVNKICKAANLRLFYFDVKQNYQDIDIKRLITGKSSIKRELKQDMNQQHSQMTIDDSSYAVFSKRKVCPKCNGEVAVKVAVRGSNIGEKFLMCRKYPYCDYKLALNDKKIVDIKRRDLKEDKHAGFKDWAG